MKWISVKDKLPSVNRCVLIAISDKDVIVKRNAHWCVPVFTGMLCEDGVWMSYMAHGCGVLDKDAVNHWALLPDCLTPHHQRKGARDAMKFTVNPEGCETSHGLPVIVKANGHLVAQMCERNLSTAKMMAAAPELLEALQRMVKGTTITGADCLCQSHDTCCYCQAHAAIAKATT